MKSAFYFPENKYHFVRRYYLIEPFDLDYNPIFQIDPIKKLSDYFEKSYIIYSKCSFDDEKFLETIGIKVDDLKKSNLYVLYFPDYNPNYYNINELEKEIIEVGKMMNIVIKPIIKNSEINESKYKTLNKKFYNQIFKKKFYDQILNRQSLDKKNKNNEEEQKTYCISKKNINSSKKVNILDCLEAKGNTLITTDNYLFPKNYDCDYVCYLSLLLERLNPKKIIHLGNRKSFNKNLFKIIKSELSYFKINLIHRDSDDFHDRFWIVKENLRGMIIGTSLNGIGKKFCYYNELNHEDIETILSYLDI